MSKHGNQQSGGGMVSGTRPPMPIQNRRYTVTPVVCGSEIREIAAALESRLEAIAAGGGRLHSIVCGPGGVLIVSEK